MPDAIHYPDLLALLERYDHERSDQWLSLVYLSCNRTKHSGGEWIELAQVKKCGLPYHCADHEMRGFIEPGGKIHAVHLRLIFQINGLTVYP